MQIIKSISIKNFRSICKLDAPIEPSDLNIVIGLNDSGKSNLLKALNLFFCGKTEFNTDFRFEDDFCKYTSVPKNKAPEIEIAITFQPPSNYKNSDKLIVWRKKWRSSGFYEERFEDESKKVYNSKKTKLIDWLRKLKYYYVPAIRDEKYFSFLMGLVHDALSEYKSGTFLKSSSDFLNGIKSQTSDLVNSLTKFTKMSSEIRMPSDFKQLFATLDFSLMTNGQHISISKHGDGIKAQHIPVILNFVGNIVKQSNEKGQSRSEIIWGFEEPENNLELSRSFSMADYFKDCSQEFQVFINTHSPAFYLLSQKSPNTRLFWVTKDKEEKTSYALKDPNNLSTINSDMGLLSMVSPFISEMEQKYKQIRNEYDSMLMDAEKPILFLEGDSDKIIFEAAAKIYFEKSNAKDLPIKIHSCNGTKFMSPLAKNGISPLVSYLSNSKAKNLLFVLTDNDGAGRETGDPQKQINDMQWKSLSENVFWRRLPFSEEMTKVFNALCIPRQLWPGVIENCFSLEFRQKAMLDGKYKMEEQFFPDLQKLPGTNLDVMRKIIDIQDKSKLELLYIKEPHHDYKVPFAEYVAKHAAKMPEILEWTKPIFDQMMQKINVAQGSHS